MPNQDFTTHFSIAQTPEAVFRAIVQVGGWWSRQVSGSTDKVGEEFEYRYEDAHRCRIRVTELVPARRVAWHVMENEFSFIADKTEWVGTDIVFDIDGTPQGARVTFTHRGLDPRDECFEVCVAGWGIAMNSLRALITTGAGSPNSA